MKTFSKIFLKISKFFFFIFGTIAAIVCLALGAVGTYKANDSKSFINTTIQTTSNTLNDVEVKLNEFESVLNDPNSSINEIISNVRNFVEEIKSTLDNQISQLNEMINKLNALSEKENNQTIKESLTEAIKQINNLIQLIGSPQDNTTETVYGIINEIIKITNQDGFLDEMKDKLLSLFNQASSYISPINDYLVSWDENKVNQTYDTVTTALLTVGSILLGLAIFGAVLSLILYKRIDGKLINRFKRKKEIIHHVEKILRKYPDVRKYLEKEM